MHVFSNKFDVMSGKFCCRQRNWKTGLCT